MENSLRASSPRENARTSGEAARGPRFRVSSRVPLARLLFTISPKWRAYSQAKRKSSRLYLSRSVPATIRM